MRSASRLTSGRIEHLAHDAEDGGVGADPQREHQRDGRGQALGVTERAQRDTHVLQERERRFDPARAPDLAHRLLRPQQVAELLHRRETRRLGVLAALDPLLDADRDVAADLVVELVRPRPHRYSSPAVAGFITRPIASTSSDQRSCSRVSWALPAARQPVVLGPLVGLAHAPLGLEPAALLEPVERGVEGARLHAEEVLRLGPDRLADAVAVPRPPLQGAQDEHVERALEQLQALVVRASGHGSRQSTAYRRRPSTACSVCSRKRDLEKVRRLAPGRVASSNS